LTELVGALFLGLLGLLGVKLTLSLGLGSRAADRERDGKRRPSHPRRRQREQAAERQQPEQDREAEWQQRQRQEPARQPEEDQWWWTVLQVSPDASADEIRSSYLKKIKQSHPDRVVWLAPESLPAAENRSKTLNAAYAEAIRARRRSSEPGPPPSEGQL
jgi:hypothetical protein